MVLTDIIRHKSFRYRGKTQDASQLIVESSAKTARAIITEIRRVRPSVGTMYVFIAGGGAPVLESEIRDEIPHAQVSEDPFCDGRGLRVQPIIEQLLYECAISGLPLMDILWSIRDAGKGGSDARRSSHSGVAAMAHQDAHDMLDSGAQNERNFAHQQPPEIDNGPPEIDIGAAPIGEGGASGEARLLAKSIIGKRTP